MFDTAGDDVLEVGDGKAPIEITGGICAPSRGPTYKRADGAKDRVIIRFGAATGKNNFLRTRPDQRGNLLARRFYRSARSLPKSVDRSSVSELPRKVREHSLEDIRLDRRSGIVIQINAIHGRLLTG